MPQNTAAKLAAEHSVSENTVKRAGKFAEEVAKTPELQKAILERRREILAGRRYNRTKQAHGGQLPKGKGQIDPSVSTAAKLAAEIVAGQAKERQGSRTDLLQKSAESQPLDTRQEIAKAADTSTCTSGRAHGDVRGHYGLVIRHSRSGECLNLTSKSIGTTSTANTGANI